MRKTLYVFGIALFFCSGLRAEWLETTKDDDRVPLESPLYGALEIQYAPVSYPHYVWVDDVRSSKQGTSIRAALEWIVLPANYGKLGVGIGFSYQKIQDVDLGEDRRASLALYPLETYLSYRFDYVADQFLVPFVRGGGRVTLVQQSSTTGGGRAGTQGYPAWDYGAGIQLCLDVLDPGSAHYFDRSSGVNATFLTVEYLRSVPMGRTANLALEHQELRAGLRFEF